MAGGWCGVPLPVEALRGKRITAVDAGHSQSLALSEEGECGCQLFGWGSEYVPGAQGSWTPTEHIWTAGSIVGKPPTRGVCGPGYAPMPPPPWWPHWNQP